MSTIVGLASISLPSIGGSSEAREAHVIQLMDRTGDFVLPLRNGIIPSKPPLYHWIGVAVAQMMGEASPFVARVPSLLAGAVMLFVTIICALQFAQPTDAPRRDQLLVISASVLSTTYLFEKMRTVAMVDAVFSAAVTVAVGIIVLRLINKETIRSSDFSIFYFNAGLAVLAKGPIGIVLPLLIAFVLLARAEGVGGALRLFARPCIGWLMFLLIATPWYFFAALRQSNEFLGRQILFENINRFIGGEHITVRPWYFYSISALRELMPWSPLIAAGLWRLRKGVEFPEKHMVGSLYLSVLTAIIFFSFSEGKRDSYLLPLLPWISVALTPQLIQLYTALGERRQFTVMRAGRAVWIAILALFFVMFTAIELMQKIDWESQNPFWHFVQNSIATDLYPASMVFTFALVIIPLVARFKSDTAWRAAAWTLSVVAVFSISLALGFSIRNRFKDFDGVAARIAARVGDQPLTVVREVRDEFFDGILYYLQREARLLPPAEFSSQCKGFTLMRHDQWLEHKDDTGAQLIETYFEIDDRMRGHEKNQKVLLYCAGVG